MTRPGHGWLAAAGAALAVALLVAIIAAHTVLPVHVPRDPPPVSVLPVRVDQGRELGRATADAVDLLLEAGHRITSPTPSPGPIGGSAWVTVDPALLATLEAEHLDDDETLDEATWWDIDGCHVVLSRPSALLAAHGLAHCLGYHDCPRCPTGHLMRPRRLGTSTRGMEGP